MPHKNVRKIIRVGSTSHAIILPKAWLRYHDLRNGDSLEVISNGKIEIIPANKHPTEEDNVDPA